MNGHSDGGDRAQRLGHQLRRLRQRKALRPAAVAEAVACDRSYVRHLEAGRRWPSARVAQRLDQALGASGELVALWAELDASPQRHRHADVAGGRGSPMLPPDAQTRYAPVQPGSVELAPTAPSAALNAALGAEPGAAADADVAAHGGIDREEGATDRFGYQREVTARGLPAVRESLQLALQLEVPAGGPLAREQLGRAIDHYALSYAAVPPLLLFDEVRACRRLAAYLLRHQRDDVRRQEVCRAAGWLSALLGNLSFHLSDAQGASMHLALAFELGQRAGERRLLAWARGAQSMLALWQGDARRALELASDGLSYASTPLLRAQLLGWAQLRALARLGERSQALQVLGEAADQLARHPDGGTPGRFGFDQAELALHAAEAYLVLDQPADAVPHAEHAEAAVNLKDLGSNGWAAGLLTLARIDARQGRADQAAERGLAVLASVPLGRLRETNRRRALALGRLLAQQRAAPHSQELAERLRELPPTPMLPPVEPPATP